MRLFCAAILAVLVAAVVWSKASAPKPEAPKQQETAPAQPPAPEKTSPFTDDYESAMKETERKVVLVFSSDNCPACVVLKNNLKEMDLDGFLFCTVDVKKNAELAKNYKVRRFPTSILIENGEETDRTVGFSKAKYEGWISGHKD